MKKIMNFINKVKCNAGKISLAVSILSMAALYVIPMNHIYGKGYIAMLFPVFFLLSQNDNSKR